MNSIEFRFGLKNNIKNFKIVGFNDASFRSLFDGSSQWGYIIYIVTAIGESCPVSWQSKKLQEIVKSVMASETLIQVECTLIE